MIQVLKRACTILEIVASDPDRDWAVGELAERLSINQTTCTNIVRSLLELGYLDASSRRRGYRLGPMAYDLARNGPYRKRLVDAALPAVEALVRALRETALVAVLAGNRKTVLFQVDRDDVYRLRQEFVESQPPYATATGRLLVAHLSDRELRSLVDSVGLPGDLWEDVADFDDLQEACRRIREAGYCETATGRSRLMGIGVPIFENSRCIAAIGMFMPMDRYGPERREGILREMRRTTDIVSRELG